jgi:hypothetical protein
MASRKKKAPALGASGNSDPRAALDGAALLDAAKPLLKTLAVDLLARADGSAAVTNALQARHAAEQKAQRTADGYPEWRRAFVEQVAAAWLLSCVFVRTLEDRGLLGKNRIAGAGALDSWRAFQQLAPSLSEREYLLTVFRELSRFPAAADLFDVRHNPVWLLAPSAEGARQLLELFRSPAPDAPTFRFGGEDTRFLGDLYQDLSEDVRKRYALLQTPRFVERFILDRTLEPAIERFGLDDTNLIDPTCGSGHFLLGAFERLFDHRLRAQPGLSAREAATKALDAVAGADINPYAVAVARFRLTLAFIEKCGINRLRDVPRLPLHLAVADSLLYNPQIGQLALVEGTDPAKWEGAHFALEDPAAARDVLFKQYAAVVGNPPYITVKDPVLRDRYREYYVSAAGKYSLAAPFAERFFQLARNGASVGMITANSFMKREFGKRLIEEYLPTVNLELIVNTSGAYIPGHGTPTVLLFGTRDKPKGTDVLAVLASRGEPSTPDDAEKGYVWSSIAEHWRDVGFENEYISVARVERSFLTKHPWSLGGGGAGELKELLEDRASSRLGDVAENIGFASFTGLDDAFIFPAYVGETQRIDQALLRPMVTGEVVRDWAIFPTESALTPYDLHTQQPLPLQPTSAWGRFLWPYRSVAQNVASFGGRSREEEGQNWWEWYRWQADRYLARFRITFAFVATHNHFVLDRGGKVFKQSAPIIKLPETATENDHLALLAYLNSSTACFWMKQVMMNKGATSDRGVLQDDPEKFRFEFDGTKLARLPLPSQLGSFRGGLLLALARCLDKGGQALATNAFEQHFLRASDTLTSIDETCRIRAELRGRMVAWQEELDWLVYELIGLVEPASPACSALSTDNVENVVAMDADQRPYRVRSATCPRRLAIDSSSLLSTIETAEYKRRWFRAAGAFNAEDTSDALLASRAARDSLLREVEVSVRSHGSAMPRAVACRTLVQNEVVHACCAFLSCEPREMIALVLSGEAIPYLARLRYSEEGIETWDAWVRTWDAQRREDAGEHVGVLPVPPKYTQNDFRSATYWALRGKLDVPKERFISYPGCESDEDKEPVYGWAGWDHLQRAVALAALYQDRKQREGWGKDRLQPMLAGLLELLPWLKQWHHEPSAELGGERPSDQFEAFLNAECSEHGFTHDDLRVWRPAAKTRGVAKRKPKKQSASAAEPESADADGAS